PTAVAVAAPLDRASGLLLGYGLRPGPPGAAQVAPESKDAPPACPTRSRCPDGPRERTVRGGPGRRDAHRAAPDARRRSRGTRHRRRRSVAQRRGELPRRPRLVLDDPARLRAGAHAQTT